MPDAAVDEAPETPAHVFAARAFKHAIFGTPAPPPTQRQPRERPQSWGGRAKIVNPTNTSRTVDSRPASYDGPARESLSTAQSPARRPGILLTPGTGGTRRKTVSFDGRNPCNNEEAIDASTQNLLPDHNPSHGGDSRNPAGRAPFQPRRREPSSFEQKLRGPEPVSEARQFDESDITVDLNAPRSRSGNYWKTEHDSNAAKTATEIRKLAKKEEVAKKYAKHRDIAAAELEEELRKEQKRAETLEAQVQQYRNRLYKALQDSAENKRSTKPAAEADDLLKLRDKEISQLKGENKSLRTRLQCLEHDIKAGDSHQRSTIVPTTEHASDIWADAGDGPQLSTTPRRRPSGSRAPLTQRDENLVTEPAVDEKKRKKASHLSTERREAAMMRIEERKRAKRQATAAAGVF